LRLEDFDYDLPEGLIARAPADRRDKSRLLVLGRRSGQITHSVFSDFPGLLRPGDLLVLNDTRVVPARLFGKRQTGGAVEMLVLPAEDWERDRFSAMISPTRRLRPGVRITFDAAPGAMVEVTGRRPDGYFDCTLTGVPSVRALLDAAGTVPLPPYMERAPIESDAERYQTVFAERDGAVAAPTAGLHFTPEMLERIKGAGVEVRFVTLHTGPGTFMPVRTEEIAAHRMHTEFYEVAPEVFESVVRARREGRRVVAVGSTSTRALESAALGGLDDPVLAGETGLFIYPGSGGVETQFRVVDAMLTNFHLPRSTLLMLVSAFAGHENVMAAYREAVKEGYRFYSYGDAMFIA